MRPFAGSLGRSSRRIKCHTLIMRKLILQLETFWLNWLVGSSPRPYQFAQPHLFAMSASAVQYVQAPMQYTTQPQEVMYVDEQGNPIQMDQNVMYVDEQGNPIQMDGQMMYYQQPAVFNIDEATFAKLAQGGSMTQEEIDALLGGGAAPSAITTATTSAKKKSMKVSKKKAKGCC